MKSKDFKYFIIVDENNWPMAFSESDEQICYCNNGKWGDDIFPVVIVTEKQAKEQIKKSKKYRNKWGWDIPGYRLMPVKVPNNFV
jgi:hypothetical protein